VVFSQWTSLLDLAGAALAAAGVRFVRLDGTMSAAARDAALRAFAADPAITVFLVSLLAGGVGLTLTAAANVFVLDASFNPAAEDQARDRVHRMGQTAAVHVFQLVARNTIEEKVIALQERKRALASGALGAPKTREEIRRLRLDDLRLLLQ
jgi:SWI/SNF-related matrix-associated actin-dependent regulator of chromatin subfamily A3